MINRILSRIIWTTERPGLTLALVGLALAMVGAIDGPLP